MCYFGKGQNKRKEIEIWKERGSKEKNIKEC
jgi:hypothetical protein